MNPPGNSTSRETPPSSENQTQRQWPGQQTLIANNESHIMNEPFLPFHDAGGRRAPASSWPQRLGIEEPRQTPIIANQESYIINQPFQPPHRATDGRRTPPSWPLRLGIEVPLQESLTINYPFLPPHHHAAGGIRTPPPSTSSSQSQLGIQEPGQPPSRFNNGSLHIKEPSPPLYSAGKRTKWPFFHNQHALRVNQESHTIKKPSSRGGGRRRSVSNQARKGASSSSNDHRCANCGRTSTPQWRKGPRGSKSLCNACGLRHWNEERRAAAATASKLQSSNIVLPPGMSSSVARCFEQGAPYGFSNIPNRFQPTDDLITTVRQNILLGHQSSILLPQEMSSSSAAPSLAPEAPYGFSQLPDRVQPMENNANPFVPENSFWGDSSGLILLRSSNIELPPEISLAAAPCLEQEAASYGFSQLPDTVQLMNNMNLSVRENSLLGDLSSELQTLSTVSPPEISTPAAPYNFSQVSSRVQLMDNASPSMSENSLLGDLLELFQSPSPPKISPPAAPDNSRGA